MTAMPMIWDRTTISCIRNMYTRGDIDEYYVQRDGMAALHKQKLAERLQRMAEEFEVVIDMRDVTFEEQRVEPWLLRVVCHWHGSNRAEFVRGARDGEVMEIDRAWLPNDIVLPEKSRREFFLTPEDDGWSPVMQTYNYRLTGWHEADRQWIYTYTGR